MKYFCLKIESALIKPLDLSVHIKMVIWELLNTPQEYTYQILKCGTQLGASGPISSINK